ncbi:hypothetical protein [uncultured Cohaesibacter sp.]|uniref:hypothetical protein n=1 Tax=uncultured Cohaesibacter sp. TaxID=1002546 RepID=UPI00292E5F80|nr:hypothetical protein [uncultured Cohaesibacter sp.]
MKHSAEKKELKAHIWERHPEDWYVEPHWCNRRLFEAEEFDGAIWDPACGLGRVLHAAECAGLPTTGSDIVERSAFCDKVIDFLECYTPRGRNIVSNPPFGRAEEFLRHALRLADGKVVFLLPLSWLTGAKRSRFLEATPLCRVHILAPRPSMPPGPVVEANIEPGGGTKDFAWFVWQRGFEGNPEVHFLRRDG